MASGIVPTKEQYLADLATKAPLVSPTFSGTPTGITKTHVGLGNVDNTSDANKPVSAAQAAINAVKADLVAGVIPTAQIPAIAITDYLGTTVNQAAMLALTGQKGDWTIRTDLGTTWVITGTDTTQMASWTALSYPTAPVQSVAGRTGIVALTSADVGLSNVNNTADTAKPVTTAQTAAFVPNLTTLTTATTSVAPTVGAIQPYSLGGGSFAPVLPALSGLTTGSTYLGIQKSFTDSSTNTATITCAGTDTFDSGATSIGLAVTGELRILQVVTISGTKYWKVLGGNTPIASLDARYANNTVKVFRPESYADLSNMSTNAGAAIQAAIDAAAAAGGGTVALSARTYICDGYTLTIPAAHYYVLSGGVQVDIVGAGRHNTRLQWNADLGAGKYAISCGDPTATFANSLGRYAQGTPGSFVGNFKDFAVEGPGSGVITGTTLGAVAVQMSGIAWGARRSMKNIYIRGFYAGIDIVGDNATFENVDSGDCYYGAYWNQQSTYYYGDLLFTKCLFGHGTMAAIGLHPLSQGIKGTMFDGCYFSGSPYGIFLESDSVTLYPYLTGDVIFDNCMFEGIGNAMFYDDNATTGSAGGGVAKGILGGMIWRNSLFGWQANQLLTAGGRDRKAMIIAGQMATCQFIGIRNAQQWIPGSVALWDGGQYKGVRIVGNMDPIFAAVAASGKPFIKTPGGGGFSANTIEFENIGYYKGTFLPQVNGGSAIAVGNLVERNGARFDRADASSTNPIFGVALAATTGGTSQAMTPVATSGEQIPVTLSGSGLANSYLKKGTTGVATAATGPSDGQVVGWLKTSSGSTGTMSTLSGGTPGAAGTNGTNGTNGQGFLYRGAWTAATAYSLYDVVTNSGSTYVVTAAHTSPGSFTTTNLSLWAAKGADGAVGAASIVSPDAALHGLLAVSAPPSNSLGTIAPVVGRTQYTKIAAASGAAINNIVLDIATAGSAAVAYLGVYDKSGNLLAQSADFGGSTTATVNITVPLTATATVPTGDAYVFVGLLIASATTAPVIRGAANGMAGTATNFGLTGALGLRSFYVTASGQTVLPSTVAVTTGTIGGGLYLIGLK